MTDKTEAQRLADRHRAVTASIVEPSRREFHMDTAAMLLKQEAATKQLREASK